MVPALPNLRLFQRALACDGLKSAYRLALTALNRTPHGPADRRGSDASALPRSGTISVHGQHIGRHVGNEAHPIGVVLALQVPHRFVGL